MGSPTISPKSRLRVRLVREHRGDRPPVPILAAAFLSDQDLSWTSHACSLAWRGGAAAGGPSWRNGQQRICQLPSFTPAGDGRFFGACPPSAFMRQTASRQTPTVNMPLGVPDLMLATSVSEICFKRLGQRREKSDQRRARWFAPPCRACRRPLSGPHGGAENQRPRLPSPSHGTSIPGTPGSTSVSPRVR